MTKKWKVEIKGKIEKEESWEVSVLHKDDRHGHISWGWPRSTKLILFGNGTGVNNLGDLSFSNKKKFAKEVAQVVCDFLNGKEE